MTYEPGCGPSKFPTLTLAQLEALTQRTDPPIFPDDLAAIAAEIRRRKDGTSEPYGGLSVP